MEVKGALHSFPSRKASPGKLPRLGCDRGEVDGLGRRQGSLSGLAPPDVSSLAKAPLAGARRQCEINVSDPATQPCSYSDSARGVGPSWRGSCWYLKNPGCGIRDPKVTARAQWGRKEAGFWPWIVSQKCPGGGLMMPVTPWGGASQPPVSASASPLAPEGQKPDATEKLPATSFKPKWPDEPLLLGWREGGL